MNESSPSPESSTPLSCPKCGATLPSAQTDGLCPRCLMAEALSPTNPSGGLPPAPDAGDLAAQFPGLEILECLGRGGMGIVYKARQPQLDRFVALKLLPRENATDFSFGERFQREAKALARLNHPNIVAIYDFGETDRYFYFLMEFVDGANLRQLQHGGSLEPGQALAIVPKLCEALQYAHDEGVVHRDIKPENILIDTRGRVKVADFGLARLLDPAQPGHTLTKTQQVMGTPHYMAPEQMEGTHAVDHRADIYSLGVVFYEMLTGSLPLGRFEAPSHRVRVDVRLDEIVLRTLERKPELRYQQASEVKTAVEGVADPAPLSEPPVREPEIAGGRIPHFSGTAIIGAVFAVLALILLGTTIYAYYEEPTWDTVPWLCSAIAPAILASVFGMAEMNRLRMREGDRSGLGLAFADAATFPLLALNFSIFGLCFLGLSWLEGSSFLTQRFIVTRALVLSAVVSLVLDTWILRRCWLALSGRKATPPRAHGLRIAGTLALLSVTAFFLLRNPLLFRAAKSGNIGLVETALALGANPNAEDGLGRTALFDAILRNDLPTAAVLVRHGADVNEATPLVWAAGLGLSGGVHYLLAEGAEIERPLSHGITALMLASATGQTKTVGRLLDGGANVNARDSGITADSYSIVSRFGASSRDTTVGEIDYTWPGKGLTSLMLAAHGGYVEIVRMLLEAGADPRIADAAGRSTTDHLGTSNREEIERLVLAASAKKIGTADFGADPLIEAASKGQTGRLRELLKEGADVNDKDSNGVTALAAAARNGHVSTVLSLILLGANGDDTDAQGRTAVMHAAENDQPAVIKALSEFETALAIVRRETKAVDPDSLIAKAESIGNPTATVPNQRPDPFILLKQRIAGVDVRIFDEIGPRMPEFRVNTAAQDKSGQTAFMKASIEGHSDCGVALQGWQDEQLQDKNGHTAAMLAALNGQEEFILAMMNAPTTGHGTSIGNYQCHAMLQPENLALADNEGKTARDLAINAGYPSIAELFDAEMHRALDHYTRAIAAGGPWSSQYYQNLGWARKALGEIDSAQSAFDEAARRASVEKNHAGRYEPDSPEP